MTKQKALHDLVPATRDLDHQPPRFSRFGGFIGAWVIGPLLALTVIAGLGALIALFVRLIIG